MVRIACNTFIADNLPHLINQDVVSGLVNRFLDPASICQTLRACPRPDRSPIPASSTTNQLGESAEISGKVAPQKSGFTKFKFKVVTSHLLSGSGWCNLLCDVSIVAATAGCAELLEVPPAYVTCVLGAEALTGCKNCVCSYLCKYLPHEICIACKGP